MAFLHIVKRENKLHEINKNRSQSAFLSL